MLTQLEKNVAKSVLLIVLSLAACKLTAGLFALIIAAIGCFAVFSDDSKKAAVYFVFLPLFPSFSYVLVSGSYLGISVKIGQIVLIFCMFVSHRIRRREDAIPIKVLFIYSIVAFLSSVDGWMPLISYLKLINFCIFLLGISFIGNMMQESEEILYYLRVNLLAIAFFIIGGSIITYFIPSIGYSMEIQKAQIYGIYRTGAEIALREKSYFSGVMNHSQTLAANVPLWFAWTLCDMFIIEKKFSRIHTAIICFSPILMYMSFSRTSIFVLCMSLLLIWCILLPNITLSVRDRVRIKIFFFAIIGILFVSLIALQIQNQKLSKWLRKNNSLEDDQRSLIEAITESRLGLIKYNLNDFRLNPLLGKGFQVMNWHSMAYKQGHISLFSAPIEKGNLPLMVLGETGCVGFVVFCIFLFQFYNICLKRHYTVLICLFTTLLVANMSEAAFFSPGGGTLQWTSTIIGGFCLDMIAKIHHVGNIRNVYA